MLCLLCLICNFLVAQQNPSKGTTGQLGKKLDDQMRLITDKGFSGALFVAKDGRIMLEKGYGMANRENKTPYTAETVFDIGSITKQFTGAAILKLEMQGKVRTNDKITKYFRDVPPDKADITLHQLLTHSAGFLHAVGDDYEKLARDAVIQKALASKLQYVPGAKHDYSNVGYSLLGAIIETATGGSYERYLHDNLFKPAGMRKTGYVIPKWKVERLAVGYREDGKRWGTPLDHLWDKDGPYWNLRANGGILSTVGDLYKWHLALESEKILSKEAKEKYFAPHIAEQPEAISFYGYGWVNEKTPRGTTLIWHDGGNGYFYADFRRYIDEKVVYIIATNSRISPFRKEYAEVLQSLFNADPGK